MDRNRYRAERRQQLANARRGRQMKPKGLFHLMALEALRSLRSLFYRRLAPSLVVVMVREEVRHG